MTQPKSKAHDLAKQYAVNKYGINEGLDPFEDELSNSVKDDCVETYLAGFRAAVEEAERLYCDGGNPKILLQDLKKLLEPPSIRQQIKDILDDN